MWTKHDWRACPIAQAPQYPDKLALDAVEAELRALPPLIFAGEARALKAHLARVAAGEAFLLQGAGLNKATSKRVYLVRRDGTEQEVPGWIVPLAGGQPPSDTQYILTVIKIFDIPVCLK